MTVYGYTRVSTDEQVKGTSLETQRPEIQGVAMSNHLEIDQWIEDGGISGTRPFFKRLAEHNIVLQSGDVIICAKLDRFSRNMSDYMATVDGLKKINVSLLINGNGDVTDDSNPMAVLMNTIMAAMADFYAADFREKNKLGKAAKKKRKGYIGGAVPHGYRVQGSGRSSKLIPIAEEQKMLAFIKDLALKKNQRQRPYSSRDVQKMAKSMYPDIRIPSHTTINKILNEVRDESDFG